MTYTVPKQLIPVAGKPLLYHVFDLLPPEVDGVVLATGYKAGVIDRYVADHPLKVPVHTVPEREPLGTGGGMRNAGDGMSDPFLLLNSDVVSGVDVKALIDLHRRRSAYGTMYLSEVEDVRPYGVAALGPDDRIERFVEKPEPERAPSHWINAGVAVWSRSVLERIPRGAALSFERETLPTVLGLGVFGYRSDAFWEDAGTLERLLNAQRLLFRAGRGGHGAPPSEAEGEGPAAVAPHASVEGAIFGPFVTVAERAVVAPGARVEDSVIMEGARIGRGASVRRSIVGPNAVVDDDLRIDGQILDLGEPG